MSANPTRDVGGDLLGDLVREVRDRLTREGSSPTPAAVAAALRATGRPVGDATVLAVHELLSREVLGAGPLDPLLRTPGVTDILVNGPEEVYIDRGSGLERVEVSLADESAVRRLAQRLAARGQRRLDDSSPFVDVRLEDGTRFHAVLAPLARPGTALSLRIPNQRAFSLEELIDAGTLTREVAGVLRELVAARLAYLISGGTGSGKTTLLNSLLSIVDPAERLVLVEDASELRPDHPHVVGLEARPANVEGTGLVTVRDLVRQALRMRPDRLVVGEVRGAEVVDLLAALNTGHEGGCGTIHANSSLDVPARIEALGLAAGMSGAAAHSQFAAALDVVLHVSRDRGGRRRLAEIAVVSRGRDGAALVRPAVLAAPDGQARLGEAAEDLERLLERRRVS